MDVLRINSTQTHHDTQETYCVFHNRDNSLAAPHFHDFYEIMLVKSGGMNYQLCSELLSLTEGSLLLIRPGDVHCKLYTDSPCQNINIVFPAKTMNVLFEYLYNGKYLRLLQEMPYVPLIQLTASVSKQLSQDMEQLNLLSVQQQDQVCTYLRYLLVSLIHKYIFPILQNRSQSSTELRMPLWFQQLIAQMQNPENFSYRLSHWAEIAGKSPEYLCRSFQKYLHTTFSAYLNFLHLNYAANLLSHTNYPIIDIAYDSGFQSLSHFYHCFQRTFSTSPSRYRSQHTAHLRNKSTAE